MKHTLVPLACGAALLASSAHAQVATALAREGQPLPGAPAGQTVSSMGSAVANGIGGYAAIVSTTGFATLSHVFGSTTGGAGTVLRTEQSGLAGYDQTAFESFFGFSDAGNVAYSPTCTDTTTLITGIDTVWIDSTPLAVADQPIPTLPGKNYRFASRAGITANGIPYWISGIDDATTGASEGNGLFVGVGQACLAKTGDASPAPLTSTIASAGVDFDVRLSGLGTNSIYNITTTDPTATNTHLVINGQLATAAGGGFMSKGSAVPVAAGGIGGELWTNWGEMGINEAGDWFITGDTSGATATDGFLVKNGVVLYREGQVLDGLTLTGNPLGNGSHMNEAGQIAFTWMTVGNLEALFLDGDALLVEGDMVDWDGDGLLDANTAVTDFTGIAAVAAGLGGDVYFTADVNVGGTVLQGLFTISTGTPALAYCFGDGSGTACPCGNAGAAGNGCASSINPNGANLAGSGLASIGADTFVLNGTGMPNNSALYFQGTTQLGGGAGVVFGDGLRCVGGTIIRLGTRTNVAGSSQFPDVGTQSISVKGNNIAGGTRNYQTWYRNPAAFCTSDPFNLTNAVNVTWAP